MINSTITITRTQQTATVNINGDAQIAPSNSIAPTISPSGVQPVGTLFTASVGTWVGTLPITYEYRWTRNGTPINGATNSTYTSVNADEGSTIRCEVRATNDYGTSSYVASSNSSICGAVPVNTVAPTLSPSGSQVTGTVITLGNGTWTGTSPITYEYRWTRDNVVISGETANTYTILAGDDGTVIKGQVRATNAAGVSAYVTTSNQVDAVNSAYDADAQAWFDAVEATGLTLTETQKNAGNAVFVSLKDESLYNKAYSLYLPLVGGTAAANKFNAVNPLDTDAAFRLTFAGGVTHTSGITGNGTNGYANTHFNVDAESALDSLCIFMYSRTNETGDKYDIAALTGGGIGVTLRSRLADFVFGSINQNDPPSAPANTDSTGFFAVSRVNSTQEIKNVNGVNTTNARNSISKPNLELFFMTLNFAGSAFSGTFTSRNYTAFGIFEGLTTDELNTMNTIISTYNAAIA